MRELIVYAEQKGGMLVDVSLEMMAQAVQLSHRINGTISAILIGDSCGYNADELICHGAHKVYLVEDKRLALYQNAATAKVVADILSVQSPEIVLIGGTSVGTDVAARVAARLRTGLTAHCIDLSIEEIDGEDQLVQTVPGWGGRMSVKIVCPQRRPQIVTIRPGVMEKGDPDPTRRGDLIPVMPVLTEDDFGARTLAFVEEKTKAGSLDDARIIVSGGFGLYGSGGFRLIEALADVVNGEIAGTRPAVDHGWIEEERLIGQSGKNVRPRLFISIGTSGAMHYTTGFSRAQVVVAIDRNASAPIFDVAHIGIVGDLNRIIPCIIKELTKEALPERTRS
ncbi:MAG TPA: electron transfer flavoprotein subunit alpha/FixB family protein [Deltaproteobacteria bacterium]|nr:electron transfer flavoprotein subunit alpha/FixB family protein [Deltaproteobacteria bacterium]